MTIPEYNVDLRGSHNGKDTFALGDCIWFLRTEICSPRLFPHYSLDVAFHFPLLEVIAG